MTATYTAASLADIAEQFDRRGDVAERREGLATTNAARAAATAEVRIWREAADILRNTTLAA